MSLVDLKIEQPDKAAEMSAKLALERAETFSVQSAQDYESAAMELKAIKAKWNEIDAQRKALKAPVDEAARRIQSFFKPPLDFLARAEAIIKRNMVTWKTEQDRLAREEARKAEERARKERERLERQAEKAEKAGRDGRADTLRERAESIVPSMPTPSFPKVSGISGRTVWKFRVVDKAKVPDKYKVIDEKKIGAVVRALKGDTDIPGIEVYEESTIAARGT